VVAFSILNIFDGYDIDCPGLNVINIETGCDISGDFHDEFAKHINIKI
jgi:hypothetical protein